MAGTIKVAVLGVGALGQHHARIYSELQKAGKIQLIGLYDANPERAIEIAQPLPSKDISLIFLLSSNFK